VTEYLANAVLFLGAVDLRGVDVLAEYLYAHLAVVGVPREVNLGLHAVAELPQSLNERFLWRGLEFVDKTVKRCLSLHFGLTSVACANVPFDFGLTCLLVSLTVETVTPVILIAHWTQTVALVV